MQVQTYNDISEVLHLQPQSVKRKGDRSGYSYGLNDKLPKPVIIELVNDYQNPAPRRTDKTMKAAKELAKAIDNNTTVNVQVNNIVNGHDKQVSKPNVNDKQKVLTKKADNDKKEMSIPLWLMGIVLAPALLWQMEHYAAVVNDLSRIKDLTVLSYVSSWFFAFSVTGTAIVMTAAKGNMWYLYGFAIVETLANIIYCQPYTWLEWATTVLVSGAMAFTILSYSEIFAKAFQKA